MGVVAARPNLLTTDELLAAGGLTREVLYKWVAQKLIKRPTFTAALDGRPIAVWPREALARARFVSKKQGLTTKELAKLVRKRWPARK